MNVTRILVIQTATGSWGVLNLRTRANLANNDAVHIPSFLSQLFEAGNGYGFAEWVAEYDSAREKYGLVSLSVGDVICLPHGYGEWKCTANGWQIVTGSHEHASTF